MCSTNFLNCHLISKCTSVHEHAWDLITRKQWFYMLEKGARPNKKILKYDIDLHIMHQLLATTSNAAIIICGFSTYRAVNGYKQYISSFNNVYRQHNNLIFTVLLTISCLNMPDTGNECYIG